jgi:hypothetical protein
MGVLLFLSPDRQPHIEHFVEVFEPPALPEDVMKVVDESAVAWTKDHPTGALAFKYLLTGEDYSPDNFVFLLARQDADFATRRHRHNFEQFRLPLRGAMNVGKGIRLREGQVGYFPEGAPYGPQDDPLGDVPPGERMHLTLQFGGASGFGYLSPDQLRACRAALKAHGEFIDVAYRHRDGRMQDGFSAVWEHAFGKKLEFPKPRYPQPIVMDPAGFQWRGITGVPGVERKHLGTFTERGTWVEMLRFTTSATWRWTSADARRLLFVLAGDGTCGGEAIRTYSAVQIDAGEPATLTATGPTEVLLIGLPMLQAAARIAAE